MFMEDSFEAYLKMGGNFVRYVPNLMRFVWLIVSS